MMNRLSKALPKLVIPELLESVRVAHQEHLNTTSYAKHTALQKYYETMPELIDDYAEAYLGVYGRCEFSNPKRIDSILTELPILHDKVITLTRETKEPDLANKLQEISAFMKKIMYLLTLE